MPGRDARLPYDEQAAEHDKSHEQGMSQQNKVGKDSVHKKSVLEAVSQYRFINLASQAVAIKINIRTWAIRLVSFSDTSKHGPAFQSRTMA
ncbi:hypothetical protein PT7_3145 [Pusillimonas sp. T7-7]|nr:hypothetical protein PT7_3145 [Pusillimonas sp. T7-7]